MKRLLFILTLGSIFSMFILSCNKDSEKIQPEKEIIGNWKGEKAVVKIYNSEGTSVISETSINLSDPNLAEASFKQDSTFSVKIKLTAPIEVDETRTGNYKIINNKLRLTFSDPEEDAQEIPFTLLENKLIVTLGEGGNSTITYTFVKN